MKEHSPDCTKADDPQAVALWVSDRTPTLEVRCGRRRHRIAKVFKLPAGTFLCLPAYVFKARDMEMGDVDHGDADAHMHAALIDLKDGEVRTEFGRCKCGTWTIELEQVRAALAAKAPPGGVRQMIGRYGTTRGATERLMRDNAVQ